MADANYRYLVEVTTEGGIMVYPEIPDDLTEPARIATPVDIVSTSLKLAHDIDQQIIIERITASVVEATTPTAPLSASDKVSEALKERGITPEIPVEQQPAPVSVPEAPPTVAVADPTVPSA
jgi:hypothetical protein